MHSPEDHTVPEVPANPTVETLPTTGPMGTQPAATVASIMAVVAIVVGLIVQFTNITIPGDLQSFADQWGAVAVGLVIAIWNFTQGQITKGRVFAPASVAARYISKAAVMGRR